MIIFDAIIIGSGQAGNPLAKKLSEVGMRVALIESTYIGGTCVNFGCTPTKTLVGLAKLVTQAKSVSEFGIHLDKHVPDFKKIYQRKNQVVGYFRGGLENSLDNDPNITIIQGKAHFVGYKKIDVLSDGSDYNGITAEQIFINTGARPAIPNIEGLRKVKYHTSDTILDIEELPRHLLIIGGGYISLEFAQIFRRLGSVVTIMERSSRLLQHEDEDVADEMTSILENEGIEVISDAVIKRISQQKDHLIDIELSISDESLVLSGTHLLIAAGRVPNIEDLNLSLTGITVGNDGYIPVKNNLETVVDGIYALGDIKGGPAFTHVSYHDHIVVSKNLLESKRSSIRGRLIPYCVFTDPELGRIGLTELAAREKGLNFSVAKMDARFIARAVEAGKTAGFIKAIVENETKMILGAAIICEGGGELMSLLQMAMLGGITYDQLHETIFAHPTYAESLNNLFRSENIQPG